MNRDRSLELLFSRITWPSPLTRDAACREVSRLLADGTVGEAVRAAFMKWLGSRKHESVCGLALLVLLRTKADFGVCPIPVAEVCKTLPYPSLQSRLLLDEYQAEHANLPELSTLHSGMASSAFSGDAFFEEHIKAFLAPWFDHISTTIDQRGCRGFRRQWAFEWQKVLAREPISPSTDSLRYWIGGASEARVPACDPLLGEVYRSSYLRTLAWAVDGRQMSLDHALALAAQTVSIDLDLWSVSPRQSPAWWLRSEGSGGALETLPPGLFSAVGSWWAGQRVGDAPWGKDWCLVEASGRVQHSRTVYDLSIVSCFQRRLRNEDTDLKEVMQWIRNKSISGPSASTLLRGYRGCLPDCDLEPIQFGGSSFLAVNAILNASGTIPRIQWWRAKRGVWAPMPYLVEGDIEVICHADGIEYSHRGLSVARWWDWVDGLQETLPNEVPPPTGQALLVRRDLVERFATESKSAFCWIAQLSGYYQKHGYGEFSEFTYEQSFGISHLLLPLS